MKLQGTFKFQEPTKLHDHYATFAITVCAIHTAQWQAQHNANLAKKTLLTFR